ncbi:uncharacterized protein LOC129599004 [Paramacrobiotus metropolitanus]|uniref:uncharacterized protein LOC129599004 n=1 Tax=Paramacrobiotus metropolitanus TaxID=2943436 RepID=UPI00244659CE|nr:uncharacterized protein LOC129599004 [Paramacrobiotus metropolitanus]
MVNDQYFYGRLQCVAVLLVTCWLLSLTGCPSAACPTHTAVPKAGRNANATHPYSIATLDRIVEEATHDPDSDVIALAFDGPIPTANGNQAQLVRVDSGASASVVCAAHSLPYTFPQHLPEFSWTHRQRPLAFLSNGRLVNVHPGTFDLEHSVQSRPAPASPFADVSVTLTFRNASWQASGDVTCTQHCLGPLTLLPALLEPAAAPLCASHTQHFRLLVFPSAGDLFPVPLANVSVLRGADVQMSCVANARDVAHTDTLTFVWCLNGRVIATRGEHPLRALAGDVVSRHGGFPLHGISTAREFTFGVAYNRTATTVSSTLVVYSVDLHTSARVECWVRPDASEEVWRRQTAYLHVLTTLAA